MKNLQKNLVITWRFQLVSTKNKHNSSVVTGETMMCLSASPGAHGDAVRAANGRQFFERDWPASIDAINAIKCALKAHPLNISHKCQLARVVKEFNEIITTPVVVKEKALPIPSPGKDALPLKIVLKSLKSCRWWWGGELWKGGLITSDNRRPIWGDKQDIKGSVCLAMTGFLGYVSPKFQIDSRRPF